MSGENDLFEELRAAMKAGEAEKFKGVLAASGKSARDILCWDGKSLLIEAVWCESPEFVELLAPLSDLDHKDGDGMTALEHAIYSGQSRLAKLLVAGTDVCCADSWGASVLMQAAAGKMSDEVVAMIASRSDLGYKTPKGLDVFEYVDLKCRSDKAMAKHLKGLIRSAGEAAGIEKAASPANAPARPRKM